ncbi:hypothetical protein PG997_001964 [Apiospora hydei]|uniref:Uncharacterized protein n=1 Tax=Apiospora hydei TaxID=1337664 RepID=A0ABR1X845_9PEZI
MNRANWVIGRILEQGDIALKPGADWGGLRHEDLPGRDGYLVGRARRVRARVRVLPARPGAEYRDMLTAPNTEGLWRRFQKAFGFDTYRQHMLSACAQEAA